MLSYFIFSLMYFTRPSERNKLVVAVVVVVVHTVNTSI